MPGPHHGDAAWSEDQARDQKSHNELALFVALKVSHRTHPAGVLKARIHAAFRRLEALGGVEQIGQQKFRKANKFAIFMGYGCGVLVRRQGCYTYRPTVSKHLINKNGTIRKHLTNVY